MSPKQLKNCIKTSPKHLQNCVKTSPKLLQNCINMSPKHLQNCTKNVPTIPPKLYVFPFFRSGGVMDGLIRYKGLKRRVRAKQIFFIFCSVVCSFFVIGGPSDGFGGFQVGSKCSGKPPLRLPRGKAGKPPKPPPGPTTNQNTKQKNKKTLFSSDPA